MSQVAPHMFFSDLEIDHVVARSKGGPDYLANLLPTCKKCNRAKSAMSLMDYIHKKR